MRTQHAKSYLHTDFERNYHSNLNPNTNTTLTLWTSFPSTAPSTKFALHRSSHLSGGQFPPEWVPPANNAAPQTGISAGPSRWHSALTTDFRVTLALTSARRLCAAALTGRAFSGSERVIQRRKRGVAEFGARLFSRRGRTRAADVRLIRRVLSVRLRLGATRRKRSHGWSRAVWEEGRGGCVSRGPRGTSSVSDD